MLPGLLLSLAFAAILIGCAYILARSVARAEHRVIIRDRLGLPYGDVVNIPRELAASSKKGWGRGESTEQTPDAAVTHTNNDVRTRHGGVSR